MTKFTRTALMSLGLIASLAAGAAFATPAQANEYNNNGRYYGRPYHPQQPAYVAPVLNDRQIHRRLQRQGYRQIAPMHHVRGYLVTRAVDSYGRQARLTISPTTGQVIDARYHF